eukprot:8408120-Pyramimonas_sp.AAC.1
MWPPSLLHEGCEVVGDRSKRGPVSDFVRKAKRYLDWAGASGYEPGDLAAASEWRAKAGHLARTAPFTWQLGTEGKDAIFGRRRASVSVSPASVFYLSGGLGGLQKLHC